MTTFVDRVVLHAVAGDGGNGIASVHREKFKPLGGPDGGNGGRGGDVILEVTSDTASLLDIQHHPHRRAGSGAHGSGGNRSGADGADVVVNVPEGTVVLDEDGEQIVDLVGAGTRYVIARGGRGGLGNAALASARRKAPGFALLGEAGEQRDVTLELKMVADVGLIGFPSAGKSSLVSVLSAAKPKIADYPFTTLAPNLGVVSAGDTTFTVADVPGLIPGASQGKGLGLEFLRHIERCAALVHVVDCATLEPGRDPVSDVETIEAELAQYGGLADRPRLVVLNKVDVPEAADLAEMVRPMLQDAGYQVFEVSAVSHEGLRPLTFAMASLVEQARADRASAEQEAPRVLIRPVPVDDTGFEVRLETTADGDELYRVVGARPERWVRQTDFSNDEAVGYLADRLARLGVEDRLAELGAPAGCDVVIGPGDDAVIFAFEPAVAAGDSERDADGPRGGDVRVWHHEDVRAERRAIRRAHQQSRGRRRPRPGEPGTSDGGSIDPGDVPGAGSRS